MHKLARSIVCTLLLMLEFIAPADANTILVGSDAVTGNLVSINPATGATSLIGHMNVPAITGLAWDSSTNTLFGVSGLTHQLVKINPATAQTTVVGTLWLDNPGNTMMGLSYNPDNNTLYGVNNHTTTAGQLQTINRQTGAATPVGYTGAFFIGDIAYNTTNDTMYMSRAIDGTFFSLNLQTGLATGIGSFNAPGGTDAGVALAFHADVGMLMASDGNSVQPDKLYQVNVATGNATLIGSTQTLGLAAMTFVPIPEPAALMLLACSGAIGWRGRRRG